MMSPTRSRRLPPEKAPTKPIPIRMPLISHRRGCLMISNKVSPMLTAGLQTLMLIGTRGEACVRRGKGSWRWRIMRSMRLSFALAAVGSMLLAACGGTGNNGGGATSESDVSGTIRPANRGGNPTGNALVKKDEKDVKADAKALTTSTVKGISLPTDSARFDAFLFGYGAQVLSSDGKKAAFNTSEGQDALTYYSSFQLKDKSSDLPDKLGATWPGDAFGKQKAAMVIEGGWLIPYMHDTYPSVSYGSIKLPKFPVKESSLLFTTGWGCSAKTKNQDACMLFVKYMTGKVVQQQVLQSGFALPSRKDLGTDPAITANPDVKNLFDSATFATAWTFGPHESKINDAQNNAIQSVLLGKSDVKTALDKAVADANTALSGG